VTDEMKRKWEAADVCRNLCDDVLRAAEAERFQVVEHAVDVEWTDRGEHWDDELARERGVTDFPTVLFLDPDGRELTRLLHPEREGTLIKTLSVARAMAEARRANQPLMIVIRPGERDMPHSIAGIMTDELRRRWDSDSLLWGLSRKIQEATDRAGVRVFEYGPQAKGWPWIATNRDAFTEHHRATDQPVVLFLAPSGEELSRITYPITEQELLTGIEEAAAAFARRDEAAEGEGDD